MYLVYVVGKQPPKVQHDSFDEALTEAKRLSNLVDNKGREIVVLRSVATLQPVTKHEMYFGENGSYKFKDSYYENGVKV